MVFSQEFREMLEYHLTKALAESVEPELRRYWCDGVLEPEWAEDYRPEYVRKSQRIILRAWMEAARTKTAPLTHQLHSLQFELGPASLSAYLKGQDLQQWIAKGIDPTAIALEEKSGTFIIRLL